MARLKVGDRVRVSARIPTPQDMKSGLFYNHFRGLEGAVQSVFTAGEVAVNVDLDKLPEDVWKRHMQARDQMSRRWLEGLSDDVRRRLRAEDKQLALRYVVLVAAADLEKLRAPRRAA